MLFASGDVYGEPEWRPIDNMHSLARRWRSHVCLSTGLSLSTPSRQGAKSDGHEASRLLFCDLHTTSRGEEFMVVFSYFVRKEKSR